MPFWKSTLVRGEAVGLEAEVPSHPRMWDLVESLENQLTFGNMSDPHWALGYRQFEHVQPIPSGVQRTGFREFQWSQWNPLGWTLLWKKPQQTWPKTLPKETLPQAVPPSHTPS